MEREIETLQTGGPTTCGNWRPTSEQVSGCRKQGHTCREALANLGGRPVAAASTLEYRLRPVLQRVLHLVQELVGDGAIHYSMVVAQRDVAHRADGDRVVDHHRPLFNHAQAQDAHIRLADDRKPKKPAKDAWIGDRESAFLYFVGFQLFGTRAFRQIVQSP